MDCAEFQRILPYIIESGGNAEEEEHLRECKVCSDLVADLKYIADQAKLLVPMEDPSPRVWHGIRGALEREELIRPGRSARRGLLKRKSVVTWLFVLGALAVAVAWTSARGRDPRLESRPRTAEVWLDASREPQRAGLSLGNSFSGSSRVPGVLGSEHPLRFSDYDEELFLSAVETANPSMRSFYAAALTQVNQAISEARDLLRQHPDDAAANESLLAVCEQKVQLYSLAMQSLN